MKNALRYALWITLLVAICAGVWMGNLALGRTRGEIDYGVWHEIESRGGAGYYYLKGVDQANRYLDSNSAMAMISQTPLPAVSHGQVRRSCGSPWLAG